MNSESKDTVLFTIGIFALGLILGILIGYTAHPLVLIQNTIYNNTINTTGVGRANVTVNIPINTTRSQNIIGRPHINATTNISTVPRCGPNITGSCYLTPSTQNVPR
jgi:hypothetical protein